MAESEKEAQKIMLREQVEKYAQLFPRYRLYADTLIKVFDKAAKKYAPLAIVQVRPKTISSFSEKILRKNKYRDPVNEITDLCGARVITHIPEEVRAIGGFIEEHFEIDWKNTVDVSQRMKPTEFGYRSVHYIVQFKEGVFPTKEVDVNIPREVFGLKAEIQVRTILEHAWADFSHDMSYKGAFKVPLKWERELAGLAATLESIDNAFSRVHTGLKDYAASYGTYMSAEKIRSEIDNLETVIKYEPENVEIASQIGKMAIELGDWEKAIEILSKYVESDYPPILRDLGVALCKKHRGDRECYEYLQGQRYLEAACAPPNRDIDALASLAGAYKGIDEGRVRELYRQAFEIDPSNPYPLGNYLECRIGYERDVSVLSVTGTLIEAAIKRCRDQADVGMNLPWAFYDMGKFYLLLGKPYLSLTAYAKAIQISVADWMIGTSLGSIERLAVIKDQLQGYEWVQNLLLVGLAGKFPATDDGKKALKRVSKITSPTDKPIRGSVVIVAGGCDSEVESQMQEYRALLLQAFYDFKGTIVSGGTTAGISGLVGDVQQKYPDVIKTVGYVPKTTETELLDNRYTEIRLTEGNDFSPVEPLQYWIDLIASSVNPSEAKLLGVNGGKISAIEYRVALALGARVAVIQNSGREAERLLTDIDWSSSERLVQMPNDPMTVSTFIGAGASKRPYFRETIAKAIHENYISARTSSGRSSDPSLSKWDDLAENLKESNRQQADHITEKLHLIGCTIHKVRNHALVLMTFAQNEIEVMAEMEHARWNVERLVDGWRWGKIRDVSKKISPYLVPWNELPEDVKEWDRETVRKIPEYLKMEGLEVRRKKLAN